MTDLSKTVTPKSDQQNAEDYLSGPKTITITGVSADTASREQPIKISFEGDENRPWKPCLTMRRLLIALWGPNGNDYIGHRLTLYRDPDTLWGGLKVGGIRVSHASHIDKNMTIALTETRGKKRPITVKVLENDNVQRQDTKPADAPKGISKREFAVRLRELITHGTVASANEYWAANEAVRAQLSDDKILEMENALADMVENAALAAKIEKEAAQ